VSDVKFNAGNQGVTFYGGGEAIWGTSDRGVSVRTNNTERMKVWNDGHVTMSGPLNISGLGNALTIGNNQFYGDASNIALRTAADGGAVYVQGPGGGGTANLSVSGDAYANGYRVIGATGVYWQTYGGGWTMTDGAWIKAVNDKGIYTGGQVQAGSLQSNSTIKAASRITSGEYVEVNGYASIGGGCDSSNGALLGRSNDGTNQMLMCKSGAWSALGGFSRTTWVTAQGYGSAIATCPTDWTVISGGSDWWWSPETKTYGYGLTSSAPYGNGWTAVYDTRYTGAIVTAYAICAQ
jgi:hypothetical protein